MAVDLEVRPHRPGTVDEELDSSRLSLRGSTSYSCSPERWSGARLVTSTFNAGLEASNADARRGVDDLLHAVEQEQRPLIAQAVREERNRLAAALLDAENLCDRRKDERGILDGCEPHEVGAAVIEVA